MHSEPSRLAVVTAFSLKLAAAIGRPRPDGAVGAALSVAAAVGGSELSEHSEGVGAGAALSVVGGSAAVADSEHSAGVGAGAGTVSVGGGVAAARI